MGEAYVGVDVGTGSARAGVFDAAGRLIARAKRPIDVWREAGGVVEHSSADIWRAASEAVREAVEGSGLAPQAFAGVGFDATCSLVVLDPAGAPLPVGPSGAAERDVIVWMDHRATGEADRINAAGHPALRYTGGKISPEMQVPKLLWLARRMPQTFERAGHFFDLTDFLTWRATGATRRSLCTLTCKWPYLAHEGRWARDFLDSLGLQALAADGFARIGAEVARPGAPLGAGLTAEAAAAMGLPAGVKVGAGLIDAHAGAFGTLGASRGGAEADPRRRLAVILGTSSCCMAVSDEARFIEGVWGPYFSALTPGQWLTEGGQTAFGAAIDRLMSRHPAFTEATRDAGESAYEDMERDILARAGDLSRAALLAGGLHVLPDFMGNRSPHADPAMRGALVGLDLRDDRASLLELYIAALCGLAYGVAQIIATLEAGGYGFDMLVVSGGASRSPLVRRIIADATGKRVGAPVASEPVLLGAAMLGAVAAGKYDAGSAMAAMSRLADEIAPQGGEIAQFHAKKRRAYNLMQESERNIRALMSARRPAAQGAESGNDW
jgi:D-ribulokinase